MAGNCLPIAAAANYNKSDILNNADFLSYTSRGHKIKINFTWLRCQQG